MEFDIYQQILDEYGEYREKEGAQYIEQLVKLFYDAPEGKELQNEGIDGNWTSIVLEYAMNYLGETPPQMTADSLREVLFDLLPEKVTALPESAPSIIREMHLFWTFLGREFHLENAASCLKILNDQAIRKLQKEMSNPANFGMAKSFMMQGLERGFDMTSQEGIDEWMQIYNAELSEKGPGLPFPLLPSLSWPDSTEGSFFATGHRKPNSRKAAEKSKRKMAKNSRKQNRKR